MKRDWANEELTEHFSLTITELKWLSDIEGYNLLGLAVQLKCFQYLGYFVEDTEIIPAIEQDHHALTTIQADLAAKDLLPAQQLVAAGYVSAKRIIHSRDQHQIELVGPVHIDLSWQAKSEIAYDAPLSA